jgi:hypothetical protein
MGLLKAYTDQDLPPTVQERPPAATIRGWAGGTSKISADWLWGEGQHWVFAAIAPQLILHTRQTSICIARLGYSW